MQKFKITSATSIMKMMISYFDTSEEGSPIKQANVGVDFLNGKVYFDNDVPEANQLELEEAILLHFKPKESEIPTIPFELLQKVSDIRSGKFDFNYRNENNEHE